ncbi:MAG: KAP family NTPase, partial [Psychrosphaera sp.]|nr:KAP family NTPase [Psychrosphaera sp.]
INEHDAKAVAITNLKENVEKWVAAVIDQNDHQYPAFIFIDELDRCRPSYAVEMLETIKHIFDIPGVVFVVATDTEQLQHAVKAIYGAGFDARVYLSRFFNSRFSLKTPEFEDLLTVHCQIEKLSKAYFDKWGVTVWPENDDVKLTLDNITTILQAFDLSVRSAIQTTERVIATLSHLEKGAKVDILMLTALLCIKDKDEGLYEEIANSKFERKDGNLEVEFSHFLGRRFNFEHKMVAIELEPTAYESKFGYTSNSYLTGVYNAELKSYFELVFAIYFSCSFNVRVTESFSSRGMVKTRLLKITSYLANLLEEIKPQDAFIGKPANKWLEYSNVKSGLDKIPPDTYKDLVELATAIDWIDEED